MFKLLHFHRVKRTIDQLSDGSKRARTPSGGSQMPTPYQMDTSMPTQTGPHNELQSMSHSQQMTHSQSFQNVPNQQQPMKRGPGRPKKQSSSSVASILSPNMEQNIYESDGIVSPPSVDRRRKSGGQTSRSKDGLTSPPPISTIKSGAVKSRRRPSKKEQHSFESDTVPMMSPSARSNPPSLSPLPHLPSPARTPGSISSVSFTHSKDLTVNISDLDKLFEGSDEEEDDLTAKVC